MAPGHTQRYMLKKEAVVGGYPSVVSAEGEMDKAMWYVMNADDQDAVQFARAMGLISESPARLQKESNTAWGKQVSLGATTQALILLNAMHVDLNCGPQELDWLTKLSHEQVAMVYAKFEEMCGNLHNIHDPEQAAGYRKQCLTLFRTEVYNQSLAPGAGKKVKFPADIQPPYLPRMPNVSHVALMSKLDLAESSKTTEKVYVNYAVDEKFLRIIKLYESAPRPCEVRVLICGDDQLLHATLCAFLHTVQTNPTQASGLVWRFGLLPFGKSNLLAQFIARWDPWYFRHIYVPFRRRCLVLPWIEKSTGSLQHKDKLSTPARLLQAQVNQYMQEASHVCSVAVYRIECWEAHDKKAGGNEAAPDQVIPFILRCELGLQAEGESAASRLAELEVSLVRMDLGGELSKMIDEDAATYTTLSLSNVPRAGDQCSSPDPMSPWLEMHAAVSGGGKGRGRNVLANDPNQHVAEVRISVFDNARTFKILVDGQRYGPFHHVRVSRAMIANTPVVLPIQTFFPITL